MSEAEVQSLVALVGGRGQVVLSLFFAHSVPLCRASLIDVDVEELRGYHKYDVVEGDGEQGLK